MEIRQLTVADLAAYRALHRFGITEAPMGFVDVLETDAARPDAEVEAMLARGEGWGVFDGHRLIGKLTVDALPYPSPAHTFWVHAVYVHPDARGNGASSALMRAAVEAARTKGGSRIALWVNGANKHMSGSALFKQVGFLGEFPSTASVSTMSSWSSHLTKEPVFDLRAGPSQLKTPSVRRRPGGMRRH